MSTTFDLTDLDSGKWFTYKGGGKICLKPFTSTEIENINKKSKMDTRLRDEMLWDFCIVDWKDFYDVNRDPIPCVVEYKVFLMNNNKEFFKFVVDKIEAMLK